MITGVHTIVRTAEPDDARALRAVYTTDQPRAALLDRRREFLVPTAEELREVLGRKEMEKGTFYAVEDARGQVRGFCSLRSMNTEAAYAELVIALADSADYTTPIAEEAMAYALERAFLRMRLNKVVIQCLDTEEDYRALAFRHGFQSEGAQRDVFYTRGRYHALETLALFRTAYAPAGLAAAPGESHAD